MILTDEIIGIMAKKRITQKRMAQIIGIAPKTFGLKLKKGVFGSDEIEIMIDTLEIENPERIFFAKEVS